MFKKYRVLVFPGGTEIGLEINKSLRDCKDIVLYSASNAVPNHAPLVFKNHFIVPDIKQRNWLVELNKIIVKNKIDYIYPAYDDVLVALSKNRVHLKAPVVSSPYETNLITRSKSRTYKAFKNIIPVPRLYEKISNVKSWPVFLKPDKGQGSQNTYIPKDKTEALFYLKRNPNLIILEYLPGKEYTIDCFNSKKGQLLFCSGRERVRTKSGISMNSKIVKNPNWKKYGKRISENIEIHGAWFFQMKADKRGKLKLMEIAPRIGGTMATHRVKGVNFPLLSIYQQAGIDVNIMTNNYSPEIDRALINRYRHKIKYDTIYLDFDDTLILNNKVNTKLITFLYQSLNQGKKIILLSKSRREIKGRLRKYSVSENIFHKIIHIPSNDIKVRYINPRIVKSAIFIDDSFSERKAIASRYKIPTFDLSMLELLIDERN